LLHLVVAAAESVEEEYRVVKGELEAYSHDLADRPRLIVLSKCDLVSETERYERCTRLEAVTGAVVTPIAAVTGDGLATLKSRVWAALARLGAQAREPQ